VASEIELPRSDEVVRRVSRLVRSVVACFLLVGVGAFLLLMARFASFPNMDTGEQSSTVAVAGLALVGVAAIAACVPVVYFFERSRDRVAVGLCIVVLGAAYVALGAST
jgi:hypothetical protein